MRVVDYTVAHHQQERLTPPPPPKEQFSYEQYSPTTITLRNQSDAILRGMASTEAAADQHTAMMLSAQRDHHLFRQSTGAAKPFLPHIGRSSGSSSRPIRITRRKQLQPRYAVPRVEDDDAHLSASPTELQHFYDEATWRMYHLIQTARSEKQQAKQQQAQHSTAATTTATEEANYDGFFAPLPGRAPVSLLPSHPGPNLIPEDDLTATPADNKDEGVFELDDI